MSGSGGWAGLWEAGVDLVGERAFDVDERAGGLARTLEERAVGAQARELQIGEPGLARAEQLPLAADLEVFLRELEAVRRRHERLQPLLRGVRQFGRAAAR